MNSLQNLLAKLPVNYRQTNLIMFLAPAGLLAYGYYLQFYEGQEPCPLCMTQRICFYLIAISALLAVFNKTSKIAQRIFASLGLFAASVGIGVATRQLWLQSLPEDQVPACGPSFDYIIQSFPLSQAVEIMFRGNGNCAEVTWTFLGLSIAGWAFIAFSGFIIANLVQMIRKI
jgi:disulfide bond formation protein DsbB